MRAFLLLICLVAGASAQCTPSVTTAVGSRAPSQICSGDLIFNEEFDILDLETWNHEKTATGGGSDLTPCDFFLVHMRSFKFQRVINLNGGAPADECTNPQDWGCERTGSASNLLNPIISARIRTVYSFSFTYGKVEVRAKLPAGDWLWPAIWLLPRYNKYGSWPASGEIDLMEGRGNKNLVSNGQNIGTELSSSTLHFGPFWPLNGYQHAHFEKNTPAGQDHLQFSIDNEVIGTVAPPAGGFWELGQFNSQVGQVDNPWQYGNKMAPFDQPASTDFWNGRSQWLPTWQLDVNNGENAALQVDYIKVWAI
ncbi:Beta-1 [Blattella germanica]|nr:Beta-1 [Blattella germanica]